MSLECQNVFIDTELLTRIATLDTVSPPRENQVYGGKWIILKISHWHIVILSM